MAILRTRSRLSSPSQSPPPSPSPIPTGKGSRSAADSIFSEHLNRSLKIPELSLPEYVHRSVLVDIDRHSLVSREGDSVKRILRSVAEFGVFRISRHGISTEELRSTLAEADMVFRISDDRKNPYCRHYSGCEEFVWRRFEKEVAERARKVVGADKYRSFSQKMEKVANELEAIAGELAQVISESANKQLIHKGIQPGESNLSLYKYDQDGFMGEIPSSTNKKNLESCYEHALSLHLPLDQCEFRVQSERGPVSFDASPDTIIVTIGKQLEEWSLGEFKSTYGELIFEPNLCSTGVSFSVELKFSASNLDKGLVKINKTIPIADQILFIIIITLLYKCFVYISS